MRSRTTLPAQLATQLRHLRSAATPSSVETGILRWWTQTDLPAGALDEAAIDQTAFLGGYVQLENGSLAPETVRPLAALVAATTAFRPDGLLPIAVARFDYQRPRSRLVEAIRAAASELTAPDLPPTLVGQLETCRTFFACGLLHDQWGTNRPAYRGRDLSLLVAEEFHLTNPGAPLPDTIEIDLGDGAGFRAVKLGEPLNASYPDGASEAQIAVRCRYHQDEFTGRFVVALSDHPAAPVPDETFELRGDCGSRGTAWVFRATGNADRHRTLVMVEGFPGGHPADYLYDTLNQHDTVNTLREFGYDLVLVGLADGSDLIQRNAEVLIDCIRQLRSRGETELVVGGVSMGGLVSRYALARMEARDEPHVTEAFLTIDTPHRGSYTSLGAQWFVHSFLPYLPALSSYARLLDSPANQQFDIWWLHDGKPITSPLREQFINDLSAIGGYPQLPRRLAASCGRGDGVRDKPPGQQTLAWSGEPWLSAQLRMLAQDSAGTIGSGSCFFADPPDLPPLRFDAGVAWDGAPGGQQPYNAEVAAIAAGIGCGTLTHAFDTTCTVPTVSALDLDQDPLAPIPPSGSGAGPFHDYAVCDQNQAHLTLTPELSQWMLAALGAGERREAPDAQR